MTGAAMERALRKARESARDGVAPSSSAPAVRERGALFSPAMVRAILADRKSQTRRIVKPQPHEALDIGKIVAGFIDRRPHHDSVAGRVVGTRDVSVLCPLGAPGDRLWVREAWRAPHRFDGQPPRDIPTGTPIDWIADPLGGPKNIGRYRHARFMPRWASRITLEVTKVRVQRLLDITEEDAIAEGLTVWTSGTGVKHYGVERADVWETDPRKTYERLWGDINGAGAWALNPFVWAVSFRRLP